MVGYNVQGAVDVNRRNKNHVKIDRRFTTHDARIKLNSLNPEH